LLLLIFVFFIMRYHIGLIAYLPDDSRGSRFSRFSVDNFHRRDKHAHKHHKEIGEDNPRRIGGEIPKPCLRYKRARVGGAHLKADNVHGIFGIEPDFGGINRKGKYRRKPRPDKQQSRKPDIRSIETQQ
jgi:hypothetical protein